MGPATAGPVAFFALVIAFKIFPHLGMANRVCGFVNQQVLLRDIGHVFRLLANCVDNRTVVERFPFPFLFLTKVNPR